MDLNSITKASFSWQIQRPGDYPEQAQDMGLIDKDQALKACQSFPWSKELSSKIIFNTDTRQLIITRSYDGIFTVEYANFKKKRFTEFTFTK